MNAFDKNTSMGKRGVTMQAADAAMIASVDAAIDPTAVADVTSSANEESSEEKGEE
jgi:hypothetical protein